MSAPRLNATKYSLLDIEVNNAVYAGKLKMFCDDFAQSAFFEKHKVFNALDYKRMGDLRFSLSIVATMLQGYFNRDDAFEELLSRYNDDFPDGDQIHQRISRTVDFIDECGLEPKSRAWKKADLFTLFVEVDRALNLEELNLQPHIVVESLESFYQSVEQSELNSPNIYGVYYKSAIQASNDRINRVRRGVIVDGLIRGRDEAELTAELQAHGL